MSMKCICNFSHIALSLLVYMTPIFTFAQNCDLNFTYQNTGSNMTVMINEDALVTDIISVGDSLGAFMNLEGDKISTSRNWAVWVNDYLEEFPGKSDEMRYVLASIMPEQKDSEFTWGDYRERINNELADVLGNFINRVVVLTQKYYQGHQ